MQWKNTANLRANPLNIRRTLRRPVQQRSQVRHPYVTKPREATPDPVAQKRTEPYSCPYVKQLQTEMLVPTSFAQYIGVPAQDMGHSGTACRRTPDEAELWRKNREVAAEIDILPCHAECGNGLHRKPLLIKVHQHTKQWMAHF